jgi:hypothetical protein
MANRENYPASLFPLRGDLSAEAGATNVIVLSASSPLGFQIGPLLDAGFSNIGPASIALGNGTAGDFTGALKLKSILLTDTAANADLTLQNTTAATVTVPQNSPILTLSGQYWATGAVTGTDTWTLKTVLTAGLNGISNLDIVHTGSTGAAQVRFPSGTSSKPGISFVNRPGCGLYFNDVNTMGLYSDTGVLVINDGNSSVTFGSGSVNFGNKSIFWDSSRVLVWNSDAGISRLGAASLAIGDGTASNLSGKLALTMLQLGGTSASFSGLKNVGGTLVVRAADDSGLASLEAFLVQLGATDTGLSRGGSAFVCVGNGTNSDVSGTLQASTLRSTQVQEISANNASWTQGQISELVTLSTSTTFTDTAANLLPANSIIEAVVARVTTTITTATDWKLGDGTTADRFTAADAAMTSGETQIGLRHQQGSITTDATGPVQTAAAQLRITTTGTPGAGVIRVTVFYRQFVAPTS